MVKRKRLLYRIGVLSIPTLSISALVGCGQAGLIANTFNFTMPELTFTGHDGEGVMHLPDDFEIPENTHFEYKVGDLPLVKKINVPLHNRDNIELKLVADPNYTLSDQIEPKNYTVAGLEEPVNTSQFTSWPTPVAPVTFIGDNKFGEVDLTSIPNIPLNSILYMSKKEGEVYSEFVKATANLTNGEIIKLELHPAPGFYFSQQVVSSDEYTVTGLKDDAIDVTTFEFPDKTTTLFEKYRGIGHFIDKVLPEAPPNTSYQFKTEHKLSSGKTRTETSNNPPDKLDNDDLVTISVIANRGYHLVDNGKTVVEISQTYTVRGLILGEE